MTDAPADDSASEGGSASDGGAGSVAQLTATVLAEESARRDAHEGEAAPVGAMPGVGRSEAISMREGLRRGGPMLFWVLLVLGALDQLETAGLSVLAPDIRDSFGLSDGSITLLAAASGAFVALGVVPMGWIADRARRRAPIVGVAGVLWAAAVFLSGLAPNAFSFFSARFGAGIASSTSFPVHGSLLADTYPIGVRGRLSAATALAGRSMAAISPLLVGAIAAWAGGDDGWRWAFLVLSVPAGVLSIWAFFLREPIRGRWEKEDVVGEVFADQDPFPISMEAGFARLQRIRTLKSVILGFSALGFGIFMVPVLTNLFIEDRYDLGTFGRGLSATVTGIAGLAALPFVGRLYDRLYHDDPGRAVRAVGFLILPMAVLVPVQFFMPNIVLFTILGIPSAVLIVAAFIMIGPIIQSVVPYRLRGLGLSLTSIYLFCIGSTGGALVTLPLTNSFGPRTSILAVFIPASLIGGLLIIRSASSVREDLALVGRELAEELVEHERQQADPTGMPLLQVSGVDFSYGSVQVLFDVSFEVARGEVLALLGTNGAGKSTVLDLVTGLRTPDRGEIRFSGRSITFVAPEHRVRLGIHSLSGGKAVFPSLTVQANLEMGAVVHRRDRREVAERVARVLDLFPALAPIRRQRAGTLSGGQQQQLGLAMTLLHDPEVLVIDELSLGLSPVVVEELLAVVDRLRAGGQTMVIVEQSLNVALAVADRAVFLEKGQVRFDGPTADLVARDDLARAVFLGGQGEG